MRLLCLLGCTFAFTAGTADSSAAAEWRTLPLLADGKVAPEWKHVGFGSFVVDGDALRTECDPRGMGVLVYGAEKFGDCRIRVVYRPQDAKANAGVHVRIDDGILRQRPEDWVAVARDDQGKLLPGMIEKLQAASTKDNGCWYAVHHGYEVQICDRGDALHRTGAVYSLAPAVALPQAKPEAWRTMIITLRGSKVLVDVDGKRITEFDSDAPPAGDERKWFEPKREPKRPQAGYIGLQNHDPGDVVYFREVSVGPLGEKK